MKLISRLLHLRFFRKIRAKSTVVLTLAVVLLVYTFNRPQLHWLGQARNALSSVNRTGWGILKQQPTTSNDGTGASFNNISIRLQVVSNQTTTKSPLKRRRITVELVGAARLGNLMFGHASMLGMAGNVSLDPIVSGKNRLLLDSFDLGTAHQTLQASDWWTCQEKFPSVYDDSLIEKISLSERNVLLFGYFQSWRYFDHIRLRVIKEFHFKSRFTDIASKFVEAATFKHYPASAQNRTLHSSILRIGIHVRRGDMLASSSVAKGFTVANAGYVGRAMAYLEQLLTNTHPYLMYVVVSDDIKWCQSNIVSTRYPIEFNLGGNEPATDLAILASCNHTIATVGTFSWWAGYLAGGITVYYKDFPANGSETAKMFRADDYFPPTWIGLS